MVRAVRAFGGFWWEFLVGDTPELLPGVLVVLGGAWVLRQASGPDLLWVPLAILALLTATVLRGRRPKGEAPPPKG